MENTHLFAYLAGTIDADGYITVRRKVKNDKRCKRPSLYYECVIGLGETNRIVPDLLRETFGGTFAEHQSKRANTRRVFIWQASHNLAANAIRCLLPYLRLKNRQGDAVLQLHAVMTKQWEEIKHSQKPPYRITDEMNAARHALWLEVTGLNEPRNRRVHFAETAEPRIPAGTP